ncbi:hypothetical protein CROQUDRAFT_668377 [Cronartium quercuum f. sp. fusiforme G11]|uniref:Phytanoyl-CoA dioxygenase n=1 Tax=Cronartium quercuum f. sp. fusiforme G11 TaxID=708437 RepID=A0A9P6NP77_9BASI|nr:hypothetical protein CROQUDRAFT_668377 [Cronartium quercuum f. sp. fusiforme G11]
MTILNTFDYNSKSDYTQLRSHYQSHGFVIIKGLLRDQHELERLRIAADLVTERTRSSKWPHKRTIGKQFPPWNQESDDVWGVQHIMHPELDQRAFLEFYFSTSLLNLVTGLTSSKELMLGLHNLLVEPIAHDHFELDWHRDSIKASTSEKEERVLLEAHLAAHPGIQWNLALYQDECLFVVPGSHNRIRTKEERLAEGNSEEPMPGSVNVKLEAGDIVFYDAQILHRASYDTNSKRRTLHGAHLDANTDIESSGGGIIQHFDKVKLFFQEDRFDESLRGIEGETEARKMVQRFVDWCKSVREAKMDGFVQNDV